MRQSVSGYEEGISTNSGDKDKDKEIEVMDHSDKFTWSLGASSNNDKK